MHSCFGTTTRGLCEEKKMYVLVHDLESPKDIQVVEMMRINANDGIRVVASLVFGKKRMEREIRRG